MFKKATFKIISWDEEPFDEPEDGPKLARVHVKKSFHGDLSGAGNPHVRNDGPRQWGCLILRFRIGCGQLRRANRQLRATTHGVLRRRKGHGGVRGGSRVGYQRANRAFGYWQVLCRRCRGARHDVEL